MKGSLVYLLIVKYLSILFKWSHSILDWTTLSWILLLLIFETVLEGSVDRIIYRDYIVNRSSFIYFSLACSVFTTDFFVAAWNKKSGMKIQFMYSEEGSKTESVIIKTTTTTTNQH